MDEELVEERFLASFERYDEFFSLQSTLLAADLFVQPSREDDIAESGVLRKLSLILAEYQEQPYLLDPYLERLVTPVAECLRAHAKACVSDPSITSSISRVGRLADLLYNYIKFRGYKTITRFFPHEVSDLTIAMDFISLSNGPAAYSDHWALRYVVLLWLSLVCRIPFDLGQFDESGCHGQTAHMLQSIAKHYLNNAGLEREGAAVLLSRLYVRKDTKDELPNFLRWSRSVLQEPNEIFVSIAVLQVLCELFKSGASEQAHAAASYLLEISDMIESDKSLTSNTLVRKYRIKLLSRVALRLVPPRSNASKIKLRALESAENQGMIQEQGGEDDIDVPEEVEVVFGVLFKGLQDRDTIVRWSAAKGVGRLSERLPADFAAQVLETILDLFSIHTIAGASVYDMPSIAEATWHGACLASAEMARRALVPPVLLPRLLEWLSKASTAIYFDIRKGAHSIGTNVRDSAAYVIWALARAQDPSSLSPHAAKLAQSLVAVSLFDRDVSIRRAASAAFQEHVGRTGLFAHGIDVLRKTDFYSVSIRRNAFIAAAPQVAEHVEYRQALIDHLISVTLRHWDAAMRQLGAKSLRLICEIDLVLLGPSSISQVAQLLRSVDTTDLHGALVALTELAQAYHKQYGPEGDGKPQEIFALIGQIPEGTVLAPRNEQVLSATCRLIAASINMQELRLGDRSTVPYWRKLVDCGLRHKSASAQESAADAIATVSSLTDCSAEQSLGHVLGVLHYDAYPHGLNEVASYLLESVGTQSATKVMNVEARRNCFQAIPRIVAKTAPKLAQHFRSNEFRALFDALDSGLDDYTTDERGDVGSWIRVVCIRGLTSIIGDILRVSGELVEFSSFLPAHRYHTIIGRILRQGVERLDNVRQIAGECLLRILNFPLPVTQHAEDWRVKGERLMRELYLSESDGSSTKWSVGEWLFPRAVRMLEIPEYRKPVLTGLIMSVSTKTGSTRPASSSLVAYAHALPLCSSASEYSLSDLTSDLINYAQTNLASNNIVVPVLQTFNLLLEADILARLPESAAGARCVEILISVSSKNVSRLKSVQRIHESMKIIINLITLPSAAKTCLPKITEFLAHPYPRIRSAAAEYLYMVLQSRDLGWEPDEKVEEILLETEWSSGDMVKVKELAQGLVGELSSGMDAL
ncbi:tubulin folding cofactor D C terminal-domain-containing protein [Phlebopus sp. FC_14]|nr:tubulin folding cofactor D C terminal-domain-containing protein [Phlebopus sp. FC_14]